MKIQAKDGLIDTDQLNDQEAAIHEAVKNLFDVCKKFGVTSFTRVILNNKKFIGAQTTVPVTEKQQPHAECLVSSIDKYLHEISGNRLSVMIQDQGAEEMDD